MNSSDPKLIRGFGIANIVLSALSILLFILLGVLMGVMGSALTDPSLSGEISRSLQHDPEFMYEMDELYAYGYTSADVNAIMDITALMFGGLGVMIAICALLSVVSLIAGIMAVRYYKNPEKMGLLFGWSLAGAICALICGRIISVVLLVLQTICAHKQRQIASSTHTAGTYPSYPMGMPMNQHMPHGYEQPNTYGYSSNPTTAPAVHAQPIPNAQPAQPHTTATTTASMPQQSPIANPASNPEVNPTSNPDTTPSVNHEANNASTPVTPAAPAVTPEATTSTETLGETPITSPAATSGAEKPTINEEGETKQV